MHVVLQHAHPAEAATGTTIDAMSFHQGRCGHRYSPATPDSAMLVIDPAAAAASVEARQ